MDLTGLIFLSVMIEGLVTYGSTFCRAGRCQLKMLISLVLGIVVAINFQIDIFCFVGLESTIPYMSMILTGLIIGRGSNYVADIIKTAKSYFDVVGGRQ